MIKMVSLTMLFSLCALGFTGCGSTDGLEQRMQNQEARFSDRQKRWDIRGESFDRRLENMSDSADARYSRNMGNQDGF